MPKTFPVGQEVQLVSKGPLQSAQEALQESQKSGYLMYYVDGHVAWIVGATQVFKGPDWRPVWQVKHDLLSADFEHVKQVG